MDCEGDEDKGNTIVCCNCGVSIETNPTYQCIPCLRHTHGITKDIPTQVTILFCRGCDRYLEPPSTWITAERESEALKSFLTRKLRGLQKCDKVDSSFVYTEPHCKKIIIKYEIEKNIETGGAMQQTFDVEFLVAHQFCTECHRVEAKDFWTTCVQIRQKVEHKRTYYYLEQLLLKRNIARLTSSISSAGGGGLDLFFQNERDATKVASYIASSVICRSATSKKLVSHDTKSNIYNFKLTYSLEIAPICKDSAICLPPKMARGLAGMSAICLVLRVAKQIVLIDPSTAQTAEVNSLAYWKAPFHQMCFSKHLTKFIVMDTEETDVRYFTGQGHISRKHTVCDVWVQRECDIGTDKQVFCRTHLGNVLSIGDTVLGYDLRNSNLNNVELDKLSDDKIPDVLLVKKHYGDKSLRNRRRRWKLRSMGVDDKNSQNRDYMDFLDDLEEDPVLRKNVNVYHDASKVAAPEDDALDADVPTITVEEMLSELAIDDADMGEQGQEEWHDATAADEPMTTDE